VHLIFETHATSVDNETGLASGWFDCDLSPAGERQARAIGERHPALNLTAVYTSDLRRAYRTAELAFPGRQVPLIRDRRLRECDFGAMTRCPTWLIESSRGKYVDTPFPKGESYESVAERVGEWLHGLRDEAEQRRPQTVLVIGHRATYFAFEHLLRGVPLSAAVRQFWQWQPGWQYDVNAARSSSRS
jgi:broad specificity phosphatase PhoE